MKSLKGLDKYEVIEERHIGDLNSDGYLLKHRKTGAYITLLLMMMKIRCFISASVHRLRTVRG